MKNVQTTNIPWQEKYHQQSSIHNKNYNNLRGDGGGFCSVSSNVWVVPTCSRYVYSDTVSSAGELLLLLWLLGLLVFGIIKGRRRFGGKVFVRFILRCLSYSLNEADQYLDIFTKVSFLLPIPWRTVKKSSLQKKNIYILVFSKMYYFLSQ